MSRRNIPSFSDIWQKHETIYINIFIMALQRLSKAKCDLSNEDTISEKLCVFLSVICFEESKKNNCEIRTPDWEKPIQPVTEEELKGGKVRARPDFTCKFVNPFTDYAEEYEISLHIECKRLGYPTSKNWILNKNYVIDGIMRFDCKTHEYGKRALSGIMIGYIISMSAEDIFEEVNNYQNRHCNNNPALEIHLVDDKVYRYQQVLNRSNLMPVIFKLNHLWVDLNTAQ